MNYDYYRPEVPLCAETYRPEDSFLYQHGAHMIDQALALLEVLNKYIMMCGNCLGRTE